MQKLVPQCVVRIFCNECLRSTPLDPKLMFWCISFHLGAFEIPFGYCTKLGAKWANLVQLMQGFVPQSLIRISRNGRSQSTQLDPKLMFSSISFCLGAFGTVMLVHKTRCKIGQPGAIKAKVCAIKSCQNFAKQTLPIHIIGSYVFMRFFPFGYI